MARDMYQFTIYQEKPFLSFDLITNVILPVVRFDVFCITFCYLNSNCHCKSFWGVTDILLFDETQYQSLKIKEFW